MNGIPAPAKLFATVALALTLALAVASQPQAPNAVVGKTAEQVFKNIQVLKGTPAQDLNQTMHLIRADLGVDCEYCHTSTQPGKGAEKDDLEPKRTARKMMLMVLDINKNQFGGAPLVTCYTCHRGSAIPATVPVPPIHFEPENPQPDPPSVDMLLHKYIEALGGEQAIRKVTSRVITGTQDIPSGVGGGFPTPARVEQYFKAPNLILNVYRTAKYTVSDGFDGNVEWAQNTTGAVTQALPLDTTRARRNADFYDPLDLQKKYMSMSVDGIQTVNHREAYVVTGAPQDDSSEELYFDIHTGLLLRKLVVLETALGDSPFEIDYDDYRDTGSGVKIPFRVTMDPPTQRTVLTTTSTIRVLTVKDNVAVPAGKFVPPPSRQALPPAAAPSATGGATPAQ